MDYEQLDDLGMTLAEEIADHYHAMANEMAVRFLHGVLESRGIDVDDLSSDDLMMIESIAEDNWMCCV